MSRYGDYWTDPVDDPERCDPEQDWWHYDEPPPPDARSRPVRESARRAKMFAKATNTLAVMTALRGRPRQPVVAFTHHGHAWGVIINWDEDHDMQWTPRSGYRLVELDDIPF